MSGDKWYAKMLQITTNCEVSFKRAMQANHANRRALRNKRIKILTDKPNSDHLCDVELEWLLEEDWEENQRLADYTLFPPDYLFDESDKKFFYVPNDEVHHRWGMFPGIM